MTRDLQWKCGAYTKMVGKLLLVAAVGGAGISLMGGCGAEDLLRDIIVTRLVSLDESVAGADGSDGVPGVAGPQGEPGPVGPQGPPGAAGAPGVDGTDGVDGVDGQDGKDGVDGDDGTLDGILDCWVICPPSFRDPCEIVCPE